MVAQPGQPHQSAEQRQEHFCTHFSLMQALWGDYTYSAKTKRIVRLRPHRGDRGRPLFVTLALEPLWKAYAAAQPGADHKV